jgi:hypothetical protein
VFVTTYKQILAITERISGLNCRLAWSKNKFFNVNPKISTNFQLQAAAF